MFETFGTILKVKHFFRDGVAITNKGDKYSISDLLLEMYPCTLSPYYYYCLT